MGWQRHQLNHMQIICTSLQTQNHASISSFIFYRPEPLPRPVARGGGSDRLDQPPLPPPKSGQVGFLWSRFLSVREWFH